MQVSKKKFIIYTKYTNIFKPKITKSILFSDQINIGVDPERILDDIRDTINQETFETPLAVVTKKTIQNIAREFNFNSVRKHPNDAISVDT